jgi:hypothetical protein
MDQKAFDVSPEESPPAAFHFGAIKRVRGQVGAHKSAARNAAGLMVAEIYFAAASSWTGIPRALATPSP